MYPSPYCSTRVQAWSLKSGESARGLRGDYVKVLRRTHEHRGQEARPAAVVAGHRIPAEVVQHKGEAHRWEAFAQAVVRFQHEREGLGLQHPAVLVRPAAEQGGHVAAHVIDGSEDGARALAVISR